MMADNETGRPGTTQWWRLWSDYRRGLGRAAWLLDQIRSTELVHGKGLERPEGFDQCISMLAEAEAAIDKARDARRQIHQLNAAPEQQELGA